MSSSDSDDGIYGNIIKRRDKILNSYKADESNTIDDSFQIDDLDNEGFIDTVDLKKKNTRKTKRKASERGKTSKRGRKTVRTESEKGDSDCIDLTDVSEVTSGGTRRRSSRLAQNDLSSNDVSIVDVTFTKDSTSGKRRGKDTSRGRARGRSATPRGRGKTTRRRAQNRRHVIPTYSVGNTEEYDDELENVPLFSSTQKNNKAEVLDDTDTEENEELSVKVYWQSVDIFKFNIRKYQKLTEIFKFFADKEKVPIDKLLFTYDDKVLRPDHTPDTIDYNIAKFIDGGIVYHNTISHAPSNTIKGSGVKIKFQYKKSKSPLEIYIKKDDKLSLAMMKCAEHLELPLNELKFEFDGDTITGSETLQDLDMEGDECIDVKIIS